MTVITNAKIAQQIETSADYYPPGIYTGMGGTASSYLTFFDDFVLNNDALGDQFIPISAVAQHGRNSKMFVIGVIPPSATVTGRLLDRSASINTVAPKDPGALTVQTPSGDVEIVNPVTTTAPKQHVTKVLTKYGSDTVKETMYQAFVEVTGQPPTDQVLALLMAQSAFETGAWTAMYNNNFGNVRPGGGWSHQTTSYGCGEVINGKQVKFAEGEAGSTFRAYPTKEEGARDYIASLLRDSAIRKPPDVWKQALLSGDPETFSVLLKTPPPYYTASVEHYTKKMTALYNKYLELDSVAPDAYAGDWNSGSKQADVSRQVQDKTADTPYVDVKAELYTSAQRAQILETQKLLEALANIPPLRLLVNPSAFSVKGERIVSDSSWTRNGNNVIEHWGTQQEKISASGKVAGFYSIDAFNAVGPGLTRTARNYSQSWQNFQSILMVYRNNAGIYIKDPTSTIKTETNLSMLGSVYIYYDSIMYIGSFDSLRISEVDTAPHTVEYSFEFSVRAAFLLDNPNPNGSARSTTPINDQNVNLLF